MRLASQRMPSLGSSVSTGAPSPGTCAERASRCGIAWSIESIESIESIRNLGDESLGDESLGDESLPIAQGGKPAQSPDPVRRPRDTFMCGTTSCH